MEIFYYNVLIDDCQHWLFENLESAKEFDAVFSMKFSNLEDEEGKSED